MLVTELGGGAYLERENANVSSLGSPFSSLRNTARGKARQICCLVEKLATLRGSDPLRGRQWEHTDSL